MEVLNSIFDSIFNRCLKTREASVDFEGLLEKIDSLSNKLEEVKSNLDAERILLEDKVKRQDAILQAVIEVIPDMLWFKALDGKYEVANKAIRDGLLFDRNPIGKTDIELASKAKKRFGKENHTFGEVCGDSDKVVIEKAIKGVFSSKGQDGRFFEDGKIKGEMLYLEVNKAPVYVDGELIGVCGIGRDMTYYHNITQDGDLCSGCHIVKKLFDKYRFENRSGDI